MNKNNTRCAGYELQMAMQNSSIIEMTMLLVSALKINSLWPSIAVIAVCDNTTLGKVQI